MVSLLLFVIGCHVLTAIFVHLFYWICRHRQGEKHYVLLVDRPYEQMEWVLRKFHSFSRWMGIPVQVTIVPSFESYELSYMVDRWSRQCFPIHLDRHTAAYDHAIVIDLHKENDLCKLPF